MRTGKGIPAEAIRFPPADLLGLRENTRIPVTVRGEALFQQILLKKAKKADDRLLFSFRQKPLSRRTIMNKTYKVGIIGATGMVGQRFVTLLDGHPLFRPVVLAASARSAGKRYEDAVGDKWAMGVPVPAYAKDMRMLDAEADAETIARQVDFVFCAVNMKKDAIKALEERYAGLEVPVVSNNSAHRATPNVPMIIPEINADHLSVIAAQRARLGTKRGFIAVKSNCSLQSYVPLLHPLKKFGIRCAAVTTYQAISGAGKTFATMPEIVDNIIPYIGGEEQKSEEEPLKIWGPRRRRAHRQRGRSRHHVAVSARPRLRRAYGGGVRLLRTEALEDRDPCRMGGLCGRAAETRAPLRARTVHPLL